MALISFHSQSPLALNSISEQEQLRSLKNEELKWGKKSLKKSKNVIEERPKNGQVKVLDKKDQHGYTNRFKVRS